MIFLTLVRKYGQLEKSLLQIMKVDWHKVHQNSLVTYGLLKVIRRSKTSTFSYEVPLCLSERDIEGLVEVLTQKSEAKTFEYKKQVYSWCCFGVFHPPSDNCETFVEVSLNLQGSDPKILTIEVAYDHQPRQKVETPLNNKFVCQVRLNSREAAQLVNRISGKN